MERLSGLLRWLLLGLAVFLGMTYLPKLFGKSDAALQPLKPEATQAQPERNAEAFCTLEGPHFRAELGSHSAALRHFWLTDAKYQHKGQPIDLSTTPDLEQHRQLFTQWRTPAAASLDDPSWQLPVDLFDWRLTESDGHHCVFEYQDASTRLRKEISVTARPFELAVKTQIDNLASAPRRHAFALSSSEWRRTEEVHGGMFRVSPFMTHVECVPQAGKTVRLAPEDFEPEDFKGPAFTPTPIDAGDWYQMPTPPAVSAITNAYFTHALVPVSAPVLPTCQALIEYRWDSSKHAKSSDDPLSGNLYRSRLAYPVQELAPGASATYDVLTYIGPKQRDALVAAGGGSTRLIELLNLGFFAVIAKIIVVFLLKTYSLVHNWGLAIILLTLTARVLLFPLQVPSIRSMIKMRELKPEIDALNEKYKDDPQAKGLAQMELWRKHNVNPLKGCLPQLASLPVWFALYTTLQTAVELYNIPFLWFPDLSAPDPWYVLPFVIGLTYFVQQKLMPMQADPAQQKMMMYMMPAMFTVFMLFLPAGLGIYMFTNSVLGIMQQQLVEWHARRGRTATANGPAIATVEGLPRGPSSKRTSVRPKRG